MKNRSKFYYRHQRERVIAKKVYIYTVVMGIELIDYRNGRDFPHFKGRFSKGKVHCSCKMCKYEKHYNIPKHTHQSKWNAMKKEIEDFYNGED